MNSTKMTVRIVGVLFLVQLIAAALSHSVILDPILWGANFLADVSVNSIQVNIAMLLDSICGSAIVAIAVLLFPILRKHNERIALWYVGMRVIEFTGLIFTGVFLLTILSVSQEYVQAGMPESSYFQSLGDSILVARNRTQNMSLIVFCLGASMFYYLLFKAKLIPRFISVWGLIAVALLFTEMMLLTFGDSLRMILMMPMGLNEIFLGIWLIVKGFNSPLTVPNTTKQI
ncbi:MAG: DUF4386 domain-containing protein [Planctomycetota bacterium]